MTLEERDYLLALLHHYGSLLTATQHDVFADHYAYDLSYAEIAMNRSISRAAVEDSIQKATKKLKEYEEKLHLVSHKEEMIRLSEEKDYPALEEYIHGL